MKKIPVKKIIGWTVFVLVVMGLIRFGNFGTSEVKENPTSKSPSKTSSYLPAQTPIIPDPVKDEGWLYTGKVTTPNGMTQSWFIPTNKTGSTTWLPLKEDGQNHNYGYRVQQDTIIKFKSKESGKITVVKIDGKTFDVYKETSDGKFSTTVFQENEFLPVRKDAESISFTPVQEPMIVKVWRAL